MPWKPGHQKAERLSVDAQRGCRDFGQQKRRPRVRFSGDVRSSRSSRSSLTVAKLKGLCEDSCPAHKG